MNFFSSLSFHPFPIHSNLHVDQHVSNYGGSDHNCYTTLPVSHTTNTSHPTFPRGGDTVHGQGVLHHCPQGN